MERYQYPLIPKKPTEKAVLRRLGYHKQTVVETMDMARIVTMMDKAADLCRPKAKAVALRILEHKEDGVTLEGGLFLASKKLAKMLEGSQSALVMGATLDNKVVDTINHELKQGDAVFAVVLDAYASECVDDALDYIMQAQGRSDFRLGKRLTKHRFSAGYGDLDLSYQKDFFELLGMQTLDVRITDTHMLIPEKSVIAICGVEGP